MISTLWQGGRVTINLLFGKKAVKCLTRLFWKPFSCNMHETPSYLGNLKNSALGHFWEIFQGGDGGGLLTSTENLENFGKSQKISEMLGGDRVQTGG